MSQSVRALMRETGAAFAVLAIYVLTLLTPLHQAAATQRGFAELGYEAPGAWSICTAIADAQSDSQTPTAVKCPVTGTSKQNIAPPALSAALKPIYGTVVDVLAGEATQAPLIAPSSTTAHPRAPPVKV